jgi:hypothetical protein
MRSLRSLVRSGTRRRTISGAGPRLGSSAVVAEPGMTGDSRLRDSDIRHVPVNSQRTLGAGELAQTGTGSRKCLFALNMEAHRAHVNTRRQLSAQ